MNIDFGSLIGQYGYWAVAIGALLEGETALALAGFAAHQGYLKLPLVMLIAAIGGFCGDQFYFWLGRRYGIGILARFPAVAARAGRVHELIERYQEWMIVGVRFAYGFRIAGPILIGTTRRLSTRRVMLFNALGAAIWAALIGGLGWAFGATVQALLGEIARYEKWAFLALALIGAAVWPWHRRREKQKLASTKISPMAQSAESSIDIVVNGASRSVASGTTVARLLEQLGAAGKRVAVERNGEIVPKSRHADTVLAAADRLEIVIAVGGG